METLAPEPLLTSQDTPRLLSNPGPKGQLQEVEYGHIAWFKLVRVVDPELVEKIWNFPPI